MEELLLRIGLALVLLGVLLTIAALAAGISKGKYRVEWGFGGFIGPIPFGFASSKEVLLLVLGVSLLTLILIFFLLR